MWLGHSIFYPRWIGKESHRAADYRGGIGVVNNLAIARHARGLT